LNKITRILFVILLFSQLYGAAQDVHFSMFYASPLTLNPALTGVVEGSYRVTAIYRNQYRSISTPFNTYAVSFDMPLLQKQLPNDIFGVGGLLVGDKSGDGRLSTTSGQLSASYHKGLDKAHHHFLGVGVQFAYTQQSIDFANLTFPDRFNTSIENFATSPDVQAASKPNIGYFDMNAGILQQSNFGDKVGMMTGFSVYHLAQPKESFLNQDVRLANRYTVHEGLHIKITPKFYINPNLIYMYQDKAQEINIGTSFEYHMGESKSELVASLGGWYRVNDAAILMAGLEYHKVRMMFAYDINASSLVPATNGRGAFELAAIFTGIIKSKAVVYPILVPCPMM